ncbi:cytosine permease [Variovorax sp. dw_954]|uniref:purine-cytosine permease family protein n=1 Tax=Variovorax sp. dw_954 TaxID=2720078 RepID=UPI001BD4C083|nr:cytosine permease [Variovorax sp. dw_954]
MHIESTTPVAGVETRTIDMVPEHERHGAPRSQFTLWFGANMQITAVVDGALAIVFGAEALTAIVGLLIGNVLGGIVMALHSAQGPRLGLPQMISSRVQFGVRGAALPLVLVILMYLGFAATGTVLSGQAINRIFGVAAPEFGILVFGSLTALVAVVGYRLIHVVGRIATVVGILGFGYLVSMGVALLASADFLNNFKNFVLLLLAVFVPWSAVNLVDYYLVSKEKVDIPALYDCNGRYGAYNPVALGCYVLGVVVQIPFLNQAMYKGPIATMLGGADVSWIVSLVVTCLVYYPLAKRTMKVPATMIYPQGAVRPGSAPTAHPTAPVATSEARQPA